MNQLIESLFNKAIGYSHRIALWNLLFLFFAVTVSSLFFFFRIPVTIFHFPAAIVLTIVVFNYLNKRKGIKHNLILSATFSAILFFLLFLSTLIWDSTYDGITYHEEAITALSNGWNPIYNSLDKPNPWTTTKTSIWIHHYAKASWVFGAVVHKFTGSIESAKVYNLLASITLFFLSLSLFSKKINNKIIVLLIALVFAMNPISSVQLFTNYVDGFLTSYLFMLIIVLIDLFNQQDENNYRTQLTMLVSIIAILVNIKFTGLVFAIIILAVFIITKFIGNPSIQRIKKLLFLSGTSVLFALLIVGFNPYVTNLVNKGNMFYPLYGEKNTQDIMSESTPLCISGKNKYQQLFISLFSSSGSYLSTNEANPPYKFPAKISLQEIKEFSLPDVRLGGFGPLFASSFLLCMAGWIYVLLKQKRKYATEFIFIFLTIILSTLIFPEVWWPRYFPHIYLLVTFALIYLFSHELDHSSKKLKLFAKILLFVSVTNAILVMGANISAATLKTIAIRKDWNEIKNKGKSLIVYFKDTEFQSQRIKLKEFGITFQESEKPIPNSKELRCSYILQGRGPKYIISPK